MTESPPPEPQPATPEPQPATPEPQPATPEPQQGTPEPQPATPEPQQGTPEPPPVAPEAASPPSAATPSAAEPPAPSSFARLSPSAGGLMGQSFELLARATGELRRASFYVGLVALISFGPFAVLVWRALLVPSNAPIEDSSAIAGFSDAVKATSFVGLGGSLVAFVESRAIAILVLAAALEGRPLAVRDALQRARDVFWRIIWATVLVSIPIGLVQQFLESRMAELFQGVSEISLLSAAVLAAAIGSPLAYVMTGITLGDVGPVEAAKRSIRLFRARKASAVVVALFALAAELLTVAGLLAGLDLVLRAESLSHIATSDTPIAALIVLVGVVVFLFAVGTLLFTVVALAVVPQVVMFLALTHVGPGLAMARGRSRRAQPPFRWLTRPFIVVVAIGVLVAIAGLINLERGLG